MALSRSRDFSDTDQHLAEAAKALSHPARIAILRVLAQRGTCICGQIVEVLPLAQSTVSQHLKALKQAGFIKGEVEGPRSCYCLDWKAFSAAVDGFAALTTGLKQDLDNCCC